MLGTSCLDLPDQPESKLERISTSIQCSDLASFKRRRNKQQIQSIIIYWCRSLINNEQLILLINSKVLSFIMEPMVFKRCWSSQHHKSPLIQLADNDKSAIIHQQSFRKKKKEINFDQLSKTHYIQSGKSIPYETKDGIISSVSVSFEIYEHFVADKLDRNDCALHGSHKIGISSNICNPKTKKKYFIGLSSTYNQQYHRKSSFLYGNMHTRHKEEGVLFMININGKKKPIKNGIAFRKFEVITMYIDWINKLLMFKRQMQNESTENRSKNECLIKISLKNNILSSLDVKQMEWFPCAAMCLAQTDSFMWNNQVDDFIRITLLPGDIL
eukprot:449745_1